MTRTAWLLGRLNYFGFRLAGHWWINQRDEWRPSGWVCELTGKHGRETWYDGPWCLRCGSEILDDERRAKPRKMGGR